MMDFDSLGWKLSYYVTTNVMNIVFEFLKGGFCSLALMFVGFQM